MNKHCLTEFRRHWECLENNNQQLWNCRSVERPLNKCIFDNLVRLLAANPILLSLTVRPLEIGENDTRDARRRDSCTSAKEADFCDAWIAATNCILPAKCVAMRIRFESLAPMSACLSTHMQRMVRYCLFIKYPKIRSKPLLP